MGIAYASYAHYIMGDLVEKQLRDVEGVEVIMGKCDQTPVDPTKFGKPDGNCLSACIATVIGCTLESIPVFGDQPGWYYGAFVVARAQRKTETRVRGAPDQDDVNRWVEEAASLANMVAIANGNPKR